MSGHGSLIALPFFSLISLASAGVKGFSAALGVAASSSLLLFAALAALDFGALFLVEDSVAGVLGVDSFNLVAVLGVFAGFTESVLSLILRIGHAALPSHQRPRCPLLSFFSSFWTSLVVHHRPHPFHLRHHCWHHSS